MGQSPHVEEEHHLLSLERGVPRDEGLSDPVVHPTAFLMGSMLWVAPLKRAGLQLVNNAFQRGQNFLALAERGCPGDKVNHLLLGCANRIHPVWRSFLQRHHEPPLGRYFSSSSATN